VQPVQQFPKLQEAIIPNDVSYSIIDSEVIPGIKRSLTVRLNRKVSEKTLRGIALELKSRDTRDYDRTFIACLLPGMVVGSGAWATTHFNPDLEVRINGLTVEEEAALVARPESDNREIVGHWLDERPFVGSRIAIFKDHGKLYVERVFKDGGTWKEELIEKTTTVGRRFEPNINSIISDPEQRHALPETVDSPLQSTTSPGESGQTEPTAGRQFLQTKLAELDSFKSNPSFHEYGFGIGRPFNPWLKSVESNRDAADFSLQERIAVGDLMMLGLKYVNTKGLENDYTRFSRAEIIYTIHNADEGADSRFGEHYILRSNGDLEIRDRSGLICAVRKIE
jgi:hypothetical protein